MLSDMDREFVNEIALCWFASDTMDALSARDTAAVYLGRLLQANGCAHIDEIVKAAEEAWTDIYAGTDCPDHWHCDPSLAPHRCEIDREAPCATCGASRFDRPTFFRAIVTEAMGGEWVARFEVYGYELVVPVIGASRRPQRESTETRHPRGE